MCARAATCDEDRPPGAATRRPRSPHPTRARRPPPGPTELVDNRDVLRCGHSEEVALSGAPERTASRTADAVPSRSEELTLDGTLAEGPTSSPQGARPPGRSTPAPLSGGAVTSLVTHDRHLSSCNRRARSIGFTASGVQRNTGTREERARSSRRRRSASSAHLVVTSQTLSPRNGRRTCNARHHKLGCPAGAAQGTAQRSVWDADFSIVRVLHLMKAMLRAYDQLCAPPLCVIAAHWSVDDDRSLSDRSRLYVAMHFILGEVSCGRAHRRNPRPRDDTCQPVMLRKLRTSARRAGSSTLQSRHPYWPMRACAHRNRGICSHLCNLAPTSRFRPSPVDSTMPLVYRTT